MERADVLNREEVGLTDQAASEPRAARQAWLDMYDALFLVCLLLLVLVLARQSFSNPPEEDAAILMRYSRHLAEGHGIVWNVAEKPVDGATDFLFMVLLAAVTKLGVPLVAAARIVGLASHVLTVLVIYGFIRLEKNPSRLAATVSAAYLALGPGIGYVATCFGTPLFGLFACSTWWFAIRVRREGCSNADCLLFALSGLLLGLARPEGVFLAGFMMLAIIYARGFRRSVRALSVFVAVFAVLGGTYFVWHWHYFGYPLPNPFYIKGGGHLYWSSLGESLENAVFLAGPFSLVYVAGLCTPRCVRDTIFVLIPVAGFALLWILLSNAMNFYMRFQYAIMPIVLLSWFPLFRMVRQELNLPRLEDFKSPAQQASLALAGVLAAGLLLYRAIVYSFAPIWISAYDVARMMADYQGKHYTVATTEAGLLPFYSNWRTIDTWGLNNQWIAHHGTIAESSLQSERPEIVMFHAPFSPIVPTVQHEKGHFPERWFVMLECLKKYVAGNGYELAASFGSDPHDTYYYYVRRDFPDSAEIIAKIRSMPRAWDAEGRGIVNFAALQRLDTP